MLVIFYKIEILNSNIIKKNKDWCDFFSFYWIYEGLNEVLSNS